MTKIFNFALKIKGGGREGGTCEVLRPCHPPKIWNVHQDIFSAFINTIKTKNKSLKALDTNSVAHIATEFQGCSEMNLKNKTAYFSIFTSRLRNILLEPYIELDRKA